MMNLSYKIRCTNALSHWMCARIFKAEVE
ncbi:unnamed protein product, partial [Vitis vinifera]|uniref:Uncharacterized protein n=1 Tax=Vitis vinifera TaxID=29760 RepID=D7SMM5_VITVI